MYISNGKIHVGDSGMYYVGDVQENDGKIKAVIKIDRHNYTGTTSVFGIDKVNIILEGIEENGVVNCRGSAREAPGIMFTAVLEKITN